MRSTWLAAIMASVAFAGVLFGAFAGAADDPSGCGPEGTTQTTAETQTVADAAAAATGESEAATADGANAGDPCATTTSENDASSAAQDDGSQQEQPASDTSASAPAGESDSGGGSADAPASAPAPAAHEDEAPAKAAASAPARRHAAQRHVVRRHAVRRAHRARKARARTHKRVVEPEYYFPPVSVNWTALTPLAPPDFAAGTATSFAGPSFLLPIYQAAGAEYHVPWQVLASINEIETNYGANVRRSRAGAIGWMQFLPSTWLRYGLDANGDGISNPGDPVDSIFAAARYLHAAGAEHELGRAIYAYNHANWYVKRVVDRAIVIGSIPEDLLTALTAKGRLDAKAIRRATGSKGLIDPAAKIDSVGRAMLLDDGALAERVLSDDKVQVYDCGRQDIAGGVIDRRVLETLEFLAFNDLSPSVTALRCGHSFYTSSGHVSEHSYGAAVDISSINGTPILGNQGAGTITDTTIQKLLELQGVLRPHQIISLMSYTGAANTFAMADHADHIHVGFAPRREIADF